MFDRVLNLPLITSKSLQPLVTLAKLLAICLLNLINIKVLYTVLSTWPYFQHICKITKIIIVFPNHVFLYRLCSELNGKFLVNNILMFTSAWRLVTAQIQFSVIKKVKIERPEHSLAPHPLRPIRSHFWLNPSSPLKVDVIFALPL